MTWIVESKSRESGLWNRDIIVDSFDAAIKTASELNKNNDCFLIRLKDLMEK